ncbi:hypothetical protein DL771_006820 [Monosporascus sp. 5C6A]|nr:hypothetical protein DL771_006820 [Monosporascus sp. 5C6A]
MWSSPQRRLDLMKSWLQGSIRKTRGDIYAQRGGAVCYHNSAPPLPTRILDLGPPQTSTRALSWWHSLRLVVTESGDTGHYLTLSHRWGSTYHTKLMIGTLDTFKYSISFRTLPKTYQDAVTIARRLGYRYLWIDALCIIQDDTQDWLDQSEKMASIYHNADCTIATHTSRHDNAGFLDAAFEPAPHHHFIRKKKGSSSEHEFVILKSNFHNQVNQSFLSRRGWVFQERILSARILHFVKHHVFFEDTSGVKADDQPNLGRPKGYCPWTDNKLNVEDAFESPAHWYRMVERFSESELTYETDRLPAIAGLAVIFRRQDPSSVNSGIQGWFHATDMVMGTVVRPDSVSAAPRWF